MATIGQEELTRASEELASFQSFMAPAASATPAPSQASTEVPVEMPVDMTSKRSGADHDSQNQAAKWHKSQGKGYNKPKGSNDRQKSWWEKDKNQRSHDQDSDLRGVVKALGRLVLRQEDSLAVMQLDCQFINFMRSPAKSQEDNAPEWSATPQLYSVGCHWRDQKAKNPQSLQQPLRTVLFSSWLTAIRFRIEEIRTKPEVKDRAIRMGLLENDSFPYLAWSPEEGKHKKEPQDPLSMEDTLQVVAQLQQLIIHPNVIGRFHPLRKLTADMQSDVIPWTLEIQNRTQESQTTYQPVGRLIRNASTHLAASSLRPSKLGRSPLATAVDKLLQEL